MPVVSATVPDTLAWLREKHIRIFLAVVGGTTVVYTECSFDSSAALVFGSEAHGVCDEWKNATGKHAMHLPMRGQADSLNVSAAATAVLYEVVRQRTTE